MNIAFSSRAILGLLTLGLLLPAIPAAVASGPAQVNVSTVHLFSDGSVVPGSSSTLATNDAGAAMTLSTSQLSAGHVVTVWWVIFNHPEFCAGPSKGHPFRCGVTDLSNPKVEGSVMFAAGHVVSSDGTASYGGHLAVGDTSDCVSSPPLPCGHGLTNPRTADIHLVVHDHGVIAPSMISVALHNFGPCTFPPNAQGNTCRDIQFSVHEQ